MVSTIKTLITYKGVEISYDRQVVYVSGVPHTTTQLDDNNLKIIRREYERVMKERLNRKYFIYKTPNITQLLFVYSINSENNTVIQFYHEKDATQINVYNDYFIDINDLVDNNSDLKSNVAEIEEIEFSLHYNDILRYADSKKDKINELNKKYLNLKK